MKYRSRLTRLGAILDDIIEAKVTVYRGITMRSRLEAAFARHLDDRGCTWVYEPAVFGPVGEGYLPDFRIEREDGYHFIEVKPTLREVRLAARRMAVIWDTHPDATLIVACAEECRFYAATKGEKWTTWVDRWAHV